MARQVTNVVRLGTLETVSRSSVSVVFVGFRVKNCRVSSNNDGLAGGDSFFLVSVYVRWYFRLANRRCTNGDRLDDSSGLSSKEFVAVSALGVADVGDLLTWEMRSMDRGKSADSNCE